MTDIPKRWTRLGLGAVLLGAAGLSACDEGVTRSAATSGVPTYAGPDSEGTAVALDPALLLPVEERAALISGEVAAAAALARVGETAAAADHLRLAIDEVKPGGLTRLVENGLDPDLFEETAKALEAGPAPEDTDAKLAAVEANASLLQANAGGNPVNLISFLTKRALNAYREGVTLDNRVSDETAFQTAYGYAVTARRLADGMADAIADGAAEGEDDGMTEEVEGGEADSLRLELELLVRMWPSEGPVAGDVPAPLPQFMAQISRVELEVSALQ